MSEQRIILANGSRLLHEMLNRILTKTGNLRVVQEITDQEHLPKAIERSDAEWVLMSIPADSKIPEWVDTYMDTHPNVRFMALAHDGSWVKTKWLERHEEKLDDLSLRDVLRILGGVLDPA
jgi:hypothetical protein